MAARAQICGGRMSAALETIDRDLRRQENEDDARELAFSLRCGAIRAEVAKGSSTEDVIDLFFFPKNREKDFQALVRATVQSEATDAVIGAKLRVLVDECIAELAEFA